jgi:hypothetical protein
MSLNAFISYSHADEKFLEDLHKHLAMLKRERALNAWSDHNILAGDDFNPEIKSNLQNSHIFLALVSPNYLASYSCYEKEFAYALRRNQPVYPVVCPRCHSSEIRRG